MQMAITEKLMVFLNTLHCLFLHGKVNLMTEVGRKLLAVTRAGVAKGTAFPVMTAATLQILGMSERRY